MTDAAPLFVPKLPQCGAHTQAIAERSTPRQAPTGFAARRVAWTADRQSALLEQPNPPQLTVLLDEGVVERLTCGSDVILDHLLDLRRYVDHPTITIPIAGHTAGFHRGLLTAFTIRELDTDPPLVFTHAEPDTAGEVTDQLAGYQQIAQTLAATATHPQQRDAALDDCLGWYPFDFAGATS